MDYKIIFSLNSFLKLKNYINKVSTEISGFAKITKHKKEGFFYIEELFMMPQITATGVYTEFNNAKFYDEIMQKGEQPSDYRCWWHSHVWMDAYWSNKDESSINDLDIEIPDDNWFVSIVANKKGEIRCRLDIWDPIRITIDEMPWEIDFTDKGIESQVEEEVKVLNADKYTLPFDKKKKFWLNPFNQGNLPQRDIIVIPDDLE
jgi:hypothetical protein